MQYIENDNDRRTAFIAIQDGIALPIDRPRSIYINLNWVKIE